LIMETCSPGPAPKASASYPSRCKEGIALLHLLSHGKDE
jgi:hypothetical protein